MGQWRTWGLLVPDGEFMGTPLALSHTRTRPLSHTHTHTHKVHCLGRCCCCPCRLRMLGAVTGALPPGRQPALNAAATSAPALFFVQMSGDRSSETGERLVDGQSYQPSLKDMATLQMGTNIIYRLAWVTCWFPCTGGGGHHVASVYRFKQDNSRMQERWYYYDDLKSNVYASDEVWVESGLRFAETLCYKKCVRASSTPTC
jgi:hypothetical protein